MADPYVEWLDEDAARLDALASLAKEKGYTVKLFKGNKKKDGEGKPSGRSLWQSKVRFAGWAEARSLTISIDFDRTFAADPRLWGEFARGASEDGNTVVMITRREDTEENRGEIEDTVGDYADAFDSVILAGPEMQKEVAAKEAGLKVDIWVDDSPQTIKSRAFCPTGIGGGIDNTCSPRARGTSLTTKDRQAGTKTIEVGGRSGKPDDAKRSIVLVDRSADLKSNAEYLDEIEEDGADKGFAVTIEDAAQLQTDAQDIDDFWVPYDLFTSNAWDYFTDNASGSGSDGSIIDERAGEYGAISSDMMSEIVDQQMTEAWQGLEGDEDSIRREVGDDYLTEFGLDPAENTYKDLSDDQREDVFNNWKAQNEDMYVEEFEQTQENARQEAARQMRSELESSLAMTELGCCIQLYRGLSLPQAVADKIIADGYIEHTATNSWTTGRGTAKGFGAGKVLLVCRNPAVGYVRSSDQANEQEVTRPPSRMNIIGVVKTESGTVIHVEEDRGYTVGGVRDTLIEDDDSSDSPSDITNTAIAGAIDGDGDGIVNEEEKNK